MQTGEPGRVKNLDAVARDFAQRLRQQFAQDVARNPRDFKKQVIRLIRRELPPRRGRPASPQIEAALALLRQGRSVHEVLRAQVPGFEQLDTYGRYLMEKALRQAIARRRRRSLLRRSPNVTQPAKVAQLDLQAAKPRGTPNPLP